MPVEGAKHEQKGQSVLQNPGDYQILVNEDAQTLEAAVEEEDEGDYQTQKRSDQRPNDKVEKDRVQPIIVRVLDVFRRVFVPQLEVESLVEIHRIGFDRTARTVVGGNVPDAAHAAMPLAKQCAIARAQRFRRVCRRVARTN